ncbi:HNH endonuclease signature motif containing protein [Bradyrhizobium sp. HKCCYLS1011]|uniref:HNH endonuclease signature motif containing protein n=1 Tax=Bradyrhizobium sp. HKCCYLS1011 TaxID=3420733 RepID=UPI003EBCC948
MTGKFKSQYVCNGIDRKDNGQGYTIENCVPCCSVCNHAKHTMGYEQFIMWISRAYHHVAATRAMDELIDLMPPPPRVKPVNDNQQPAEKEKAA